MKRLRSISAILNIVAALLLLGAYAAPIVNPQQNVWFAFLGLGFPVLLVINIAFLFYWIVRRKILLMISLVTIIFGAKTISQFFQITFKKEGTKNAIHVMSYNVRLFDLYNWTSNKQTRNQIFKQIEAQQPDILCFQEFYQDDDSDYFVTRDTLVKFLNAKNYFEGYTHKVRGGQEFGVATFSRYPIVNVYSGKFENEINNNYIVTDLLIDEDTVRVINTHIGSIGFEEGDYQYIGGKGMTRYHKGQKKPKKVFQQKILDRLHFAFQRRPSQVLRIKEEIKKSPYPVILCGDFNDIPVSFSYGTISRLLTDSFTEKGNGLGGTYIGHVPGLRIDYIFHSNEFKAVDYKTHQEKLSDHKAISSWLKKKESH